MQIIYCHTCGHRIPNEDIEAGRVVVDDLKHFCANCVPRSVAEKPAGRSSRKIVLISPAARKSSAADITPAAAQRPPSATHPAASRSNHPHSPQQREREGM